MISEENSLARFKEILLTIKNRASQSSDAKTAAEVIGECIDKKLDRSFNNYYDNLVDNIQFLLSKNPISMIKDINKVFAPKDGDKLGEYSYDEDDYLDENGEMAEPFEEIQLEDDEDE
jgi:hypothetical protein